MPRLSIRAWLVLALLALVAVPGLTALAITFAQHDAVRADEAVVREVSAHAGRWTATAWQRRLGRRVAALHMEFMLVDGSGRIVYRAGHDPIAASAAAGWAPHRGVAHAGTVWEVALGPDAGRQGTAYLYTAMPGGAQAGQVALAALVALALTLLVIVWVVGHDELRPLAALGRSARQIGAGDLDLDRAVRVPDSRLREVADVAAAFAAMGAALHAALARQAAIEQERRLFIGAIAHDLRSPLFALRGSLRGLEKGLARSPEKAARYLAVCQDKTAALDRLVADLFTFARLEYLEQEPRREPLELGALVRRCAAARQPHAVDAGIHLGLEGPRSPCALVGDGQLLTRAVENLLDNALRYTPRGGCVRVSWRADPTDLTRLVISVADTGPGIAAHDLPHLFEPLYRGETARNAETGGAGLGLTIARRILQAHGGGLSAANSPSGGAVLTGTLAAAAAQGTAPSAGPGSPLCV